MFFLNNFFLDDACFFITSLCFFGRSIKIPACHVKLNLDNRCKAENNPILLVYNVERHCEPSNQVTIATFLLDNHCYPYI